MYVYICHKNALSLLKIDCVFICSCPALIFKLDALEELCFLGYLEGKSCCDGSVSKCLKRFRERHKCDPFYIVNYYNIKWSLTTSIEIRIGGHVNCLWNTLNEILHSIGYTVLTSKFDNIFLNHGPVVQNRCVHGARVAQGTANCIIADDGAVAPDRTTYESNAQLIECLNRKWHTLF